MESSTQPSAPITPKELLTRQLNDWHLLRTELKAKQEATPTPEVTKNLSYCESIIEALTFELQDFN